MTRSSICETYLMNHGSDQIAINLTIHSPTPPTPRDISCHVRNRMLDKIVFRQSQFFADIIISPVSCDKQLNLEPIIIGKHMTNKSK